MKYFRVPRPGNDLIILVLVIAVVLAVVSISLILLMPYTKSGNSQPVSKATPADSTEINHVVIPLLEPVTSKNHTVRNRQGKIQNNKLWRSVNPPMTGGPPVRPAMRSRVTNVTKASTASTATDYTLSQPVRKSTSRQKALPDESAHVAPIKAVNNAIPSCPDETRGQGCTIPPVSNLAQDEDGAQEASAVPLPPPGHPPEENDSGR